MATKRNYYSIATLLVQLLLLSNSVSSLKRPQNAIAVVNNQWQTLRGGGREDISKYYAPAPPPPPPPKDASEQVKDGLKVGILALISVAWLSWPFGNNKESSNQSNHKVDTSSSYSTSLPIKKKQLNKKPKRELKFIPPEWNNKSKYFPQKNKNQDSLAQVVENFNFFMLIPFAALLFIFRDKWTGLFNFKEHKQLLQTKTLDILRDLDAMPRYVSYPVYGLIMTAWEMIGLSTIPIETAAGMVFGWPVGFYLSGFGKLAGAILAFFVGRYGMLADWARQKLLKKNTFLQLIQNSAYEHPFRVAMILRFSFFPETIKNYGSALLRPIQWWMFVLGVLIHGGAYTWLWTNLGDDAAARLVSDGTLPPDRILQVSLGIAVIFGFIISPLALGYWIKTLKDDYDSDDSGATAVANTNMRN